MRHVLPIALVVLFGGTSGILAQTGHGNHSSMAAERVSPEESVSEARLTEPGQGAFAALSEVVRVLEADPATDWSRVDLNDLRDHLVDMDRLVTDTLVDEEGLPDGVRARVTGDTETLASLRRMVPAHAAELARDRRWTIDAAVTEDAVVLTATSDDPSVVARIRGLGFYGLMASQDHHRAHHLAIARGDDAHAR